MRILSFTIFFTVESWHSINLFWGVKSIVNTEISEDFLLFVK